MPSPSKRPRLSTSTPPLSTPRSSSTSVSIESLTAVLPDPSHQSALRFFTTLAALPGKYTLDEEDDDIVDFETDSIIPGKKGLLTRSKAEWQFGCFAPPRVAEDGEVESGTPVEDEVEDGDELDLIRPRSPSKSPTKDSSRANSVHLPEYSALHLAPLDPKNNQQDAEDLQEFLREEALSNQRLQDSTADEQSEEEAREGEEEEEEEEEERYNETYEDSEVPIPAEDEEGESYAVPDEDEESDDMDGYDAGEGSIIRNPDGSIRSMPTPRGRSRSISVKPIQQSLHHLPIKQPIFSRSPSKQPAEAQRSPSRAPSTPLPDFATSISEYSPPSSPLKDIRIRTRSRPSLNERRPSSSSATDPFVRPSTPQLNASNTRRPTSPEVLPPPPTPPKRAARLLEPNPYPSPSSSSRRTPKRAGILSPYSQTLLEGPVNEGWDDDSLSPVSRNTRSRKGKEVERQVEEPIGSRNKISTPPSKRVTHPIPDKSPACSSKSRSPPKGRKRKRSVSLDLPDEEGSPHQADEMEDRFHYPFRTRSRSPVGSSHPARRELSSQQQQCRPVTPRKVLGDIETSPSESLGLSRARLDAIHLHRSLSRTRVAQDDKISISPQRRSRQPEPVPASYSGEYEGLLDQRLPPASDSSASCTHLPFHPHPQPFSFQHPHHQHHPQAVFTQAMQAMQAMSAMMMQYANVVNQGQPGQQLPIIMPSPELGPSRWPTEGTDSRLRERTKWPNNQTRTPSTSSSPVRYPPPSSSPSSAYSYEERESDIGPSSDQGTRSGGAVTQMLSEPGSLSHLRSAIVSRPSSLSRGRRPGSRIRKRVSFELKSVGQVINISSDEYEEDHNLIEGDQEDDHQHQPRHEGPRRMVRAATPGPSDRPILRQSSRISKNRLSRQNTPAGRT